MNTTPRCITPEEFEAMQCTIVKANALDSKSSAATDDFYTSADGSTHVNLIALENGEVIYLAVPA